CRHRSGGPPRSTSRGLSSIRVHGRSMAIGKAAWRIGLTALFLSPPLAIWAVHRFGADIAREIALRELGRVVPAEVRFGHFDVSALPPRVIATDLEIWDRGTRLIA